MTITRYILALFFLFCYSCNNDGSVVYNIEDPPPEILNNLEGYGCSSSTVCYPLSEIYYDFSSQALYQGFYKFDKAWSEGGFHNPYSDTLGLYTFNNSYLMAVPSAYIESEDENNTVIISDNGNFIFQDLNNLSDLPSDLVDLESQPPIPRFRDELLSLSSNPLSNISNVIWNPAQLRYVPNTTASKVYNKSFYFTQEYDSIIQTTLIDTGNTNIYDDIILLDYNEIVQRTITLYDTINTVDPVKSKRNVSFRIKNTYISNDGPYWQENTDCNDNYQKDVEEVVLFDGYVNSYGVNPKSFEAWCLMDACIGEDSEDFSLSKQECCNNNPYGYGCVDGNGNIDASIDINSSNPEELCCLQNSGSWDSNATCLNATGETLPGWDGSLDGCNDNTSQTEWDYGPDWDHDDTQHNPVGYCFGYETIYLNEVDCLSSSATWIASQGTEDIPQTGEENEDDSDDVAIGCSNGGASSSGLYDDCDNSTPNTSETSWDYGPPWDHDGVPYIEGECILNQDNCLAENLIWTSVLGGGFCSENNIEENECHDITNTSVADSCSEGGTSSSGNYDDCDNSLVNTAVYTGAVDETFTCIGNESVDQALCEADDIAASPGIDFTWDSGSGNDTDNTCVDEDGNEAEGWNSSDDEAACDAYDVTAVDYDDGGTAWTGNGDAIAESCIVDGSPLDGWVTGNVSCDNSVANTSIANSCSNGGSTSSGNFDDCSNSTWIFEEGTENVQQDGLVDEPTDDDVATGCTNSGESAAGNFLDCDNSEINTSETLWDYGLPWNHDLLEYVPAYCFSTNQEQCDYCADGTGQDTGESYDSCSGLWMDWQDMIISPNIPQTGEPCNSDICEPTDDNVAIGCDNGGSSESGDFDDCNN